MFRRGFFPSTHGSPVLEVSVLVLDDAVPVHLAVLGDLAHAQDQDLVHQLRGDGGCDLQDKKRSII